jgi:hypothetical protein
MMGHLLPRVLCISRDSKATSATQKVPEHDNIPEFLESENLTNHTKCG